MTIFDLSVDEEYEQLENQRTEQQKRYGELFAFSITRQCPLKCDHCIVNSDPISKKHKVNCENFKIIVKNIVLQKKIKQLSITGGEPFSIPRQLMYVSNQASKNKIKVGVVTSAYWAKTPESAEKTIENFSDIDAYAISTDIHHQKYIPLQNVKNAYFAIKKHNKKVDIRIAHQYNPTDSEKKVITQVQSFVKDPSEIKTQTILPFGRATQFMESDSLNFGPSISSLPCFSNAPLVLENGIVEPCCGALTALKIKHPMILGDLITDSIQDIRDNAFKNALFQHIRLWGFRDLIPLIKKSKWKKCLPQLVGQSDTCSTCALIFSNPELADYLMEKSNELSFQFKVGLGMYYYFDNNKMLKFIETKCKN